MNRVDGISVVFGIVQTAFYIDFAWVYWTRQRVKLRNGGVVDSDDLSRGWLLSRLLGQQGGGMDAEEGIVPREESNGNQRSSARGKWGARGISVSADDEDATDPWHTQKTNFPSKDSNLGNDDLDDVLDDGQDNDIDDRHLSQSDQSNDGKNIANGRR